MEMTAICVHNVSTSSGVHESLYVSYRLVTLARWFQTSIRTPQKFKFRNITCTERPSLLLNERHSLCCPRRKKRRGMKMRPGSPQRFRRRRLANSTHKSRSNYLRITDREPGLHANNPKNLNPSNTWNRNLFVCRDNRVWRRGRGRSRPVGKVSRTISFEFSSNIARRL